MADNAYSGRENLLAAKRAGAAAFIPFKSNATGRSYGTGGSWSKDFHFFQMHSEAFDARYHKRSNVEAAISAVKKKLDETLKSKNATAQENELLCKIAYNLTVLIHEMHENGVEPDWFSEKGSLGQGGI
jgi:transposase